jgi:ClpP class serine protease
MTLQNIENFLSAFGLASLASHPVAVDVPMLMQDYLAGRVRIRAESSRGAADEDVQGHPNALRLLQLGARVVAIQPINGVIVSGASPEMEDWYGVFNLDRIHQAVRTVASNPQISALILQLDTPGGSVLGLRAAADALRSISAMRPGVEVIAYSQRLAASAGMYLAAAADAIHAAPGAYVGSIGTIASLSDASGFWAKLGVEKRVYTADSALKGLGAGPITDAHDAHMRQMVQTYSDEFKGWMAERRGITAAAMQGQAWEARLAPSGLVDSASIPTFEEFLGALL